MEVLVVLALIGLTLFFTIPRFGAGIAADPALRAARWILVTVETLKRKAVLDQQQRTLHLDISANRLWVTRGEKPTDGKKPVVTEGGFDLKGSAALMDVVYPQGGKTTLGEALIRFYPQGYSDRAVIHLESGDRRRFSFQIEPFLARAKLFEHYKEFEE